MGRRRIQEGGGGWGRKEGRVDPDGEEEEEEKKETRNRDLAVSGLRPRDGREVGIWKGGRRVEETPPHVHHRHLSGCGAVPIACFSLHRLVSRRARACVAA